MAALPRFALPLAAILSLALPAAASAQVTDETTAATPLVGDETLPETPEAELAYARDAGVVFASVAEGPRDKVNTSDKLSCDSKMAKLLDDPGAREVLQRRIPDVISDPRIFMARGMTLNQLAKHRQSGITPAVLSEIDADLASASAR